MIQWLGLRAFNTVILGLIPGQGTKIPQAKQYNQKKTFLDKNSNITDFF